MDGFLETNVSSSSRIQVTVQSLLEGGKKEDNTPRPSIFMVLSTVRDLRPSSFNPRVVSIGPLHREDENVQAFEGRKASYMINLVSRIDRPQEETLQSCVEKAYASMERIKACYMWTKEYKDDEIAKMMVMDACFILGFVLLVHEPDVASRRNNSLIQAVIYDLVLLENQIPLFFLEEIFNCTIPKFKPHVSLVEFLSPVLDQLMLFVGDKISFYNFSTVSTPHILGLLHECYKPPDDNIQTCTLTSTTRSALDLDRAGVHFRPHKNPTWIMQMEVKLHRYLCIFWSWSKTTLKMPVLKVHHFSELVLRNLIAYEQFSRTSKYITSYVVAMDMLVNTQEDVAMLIDSEVLVNYMGSNEEAANMINNIIKEVACDDFFYGEQLDALNKYYNGYWPKHIARMRRTYFSSPWNMIALVA